jgi:hypothetical protein
LWASFFDIHGVEELGSRAAALGSNIGAGLLSAKSIHSNFLEDSLFKFAGGFDPPSRAKTIDYTAVKNKRVRGRIPAATASLLEDILQSSVFDFGDMFDMVECRAHSLHC